MVGPPRGKRFRRRERLFVGARLRHDEYGLLELRGYGYSNDARGLFVKLVAVEDDGGGVPEQWSLDRGGSNSLRRAFGKGEIELV